MKNRPNIVVSVVALVSILLTSVLNANEAKRQAYFGELHLHTGLSTDAYINGTRKHPDTAYRFAQGDPVMLQDGQFWQLSRTLDFVAITDHAESFGDLPLCLQPDNPAFRLPICKQVRAGNPVASQQLIGRWQITSAQRHAGICGEDGSRCTETEKTTWQTLQESANRMNKPGEFTALIGYEYSPVILSYSGTSKVHRNVIFRGDQVPGQAFSSYDGTIEQLHAWLDETCKEPCRALTIPHNTNASASRIFWPDKNSDGTPWTKEILERRTRLEPLVELYQGKGSSECHPGLGMTDEECGFEQWVPNCSEDNLLGCSTTNDMVRDTLVRGLAVEQKWGINPFQLGFVGSTDSHLGTPGATEENDYRGQLGYPDDSPARRLGLESYYDYEGREEVNMEEGGWGFMGPTKFSPGGLAVAWADDNTREDIWDALARRETYSTSGTRIQVRFFGGFDFDGDAHQRNNFIKQGYRKGVPMGGELAAAADGQSPTFIVAALRDPQNAPLQKLQVIKGWVENGEARSAVYDVACAGGAQPDASTARCPAREASVDLKTCAIDETQGDAQLATTWTDPDFNASESALYYVRVLENPVCRWSTYDARRVGAELPEHVPATIKERAWTSPIWYKP
ncbi:DUF3604 domain-containing protein [Halieaceae bacterium IMCC8485]|uniref:DUF3604 domain-containing protein n=1 Tax=Candidatus Seongchinamella marina TaxID=2518990 RepID=A0ABT3T0R3_9GAMM|nr:DUF3604 domain-containing protein [Candidatus Seongchinamella marina]MCX2975421.1 DUF3604 domain-containing protein [Candidatus Seongchinamella marina]